MRVSDRMSAPAVTVRADLDYRQALRLMQEHALHHIPVLDAGGRLSGMLTERDLLLAATRFLQSGVEVSEIMHRGAYTTTPDMALADAAELMVRHKIGGLPVVDSNGTLVGIVTETDIFRAFVDMSAARTS